MDRNREARRAAAMTNGLPRRRHRTTTGGSLRESPEDESPMELQETAARLRDRTVKKDRDREVRDRERDRERERERDRDRDRDRDRERERDRDRLNRSKRRRSDKYIHREDGGGGGGAGDDSSEGSVNDEEEEEDEGQVRYVPPPNPAVVPSASPASTLMSHRKSYPPPSKVIRVAPTWKAPDEMIGVSIPRKARSASTKRGHDCWSSAGVGSNGEQPVNMNRQASPSPVRSTTPGQTPVTAAAAPPPPLPSQGRPMSPSSSNISVKKKIKAANGPKQQRPPKSSKSSPPVQDDIEIEVAEVLYGLKRQSHAPSKQDAGTSNDSTIKLDSRSIHDSKSKVSSPLPNSSSLHNHNNINNPSTSSSIPPTTIAAPKRKKSRPYHEEIPGNLSHRSSPKAAELDQPPKMEAPPQSTDMKAEIENGGEMVNNKEAQAEAAAATVVASNDMLSDAKKGLAEESAGIRNGMLRAKVEEASTSPKLESPQNHDRVESSTTSTKTNFVEQENPREDKLEIDLMAPPPQARASPERVEEMAEYGGRDEKCMVTERETDAKARLEEDEKVGQSRGSGGVESKKAEADTSKFVPPPSTSSQAELNLNGKERERKIDLHLDLEKTSVNDDKLNVQKPQPPPKVTRDDATTDTKPGGQSGSGPLPLSVPGGWHGGLPPMGYVGPLQGVVSMDGTPMASPPIQHPTPHFLFTQPKPKRCATHCYVARSISVHQQMMKMNPFWPAAAAAAAVGTAPLFGGKPYNLNMMPSADLHAAAAAGRGVVVNSSQDNKGQPFTLFPGQPASSSKDKSPQTTSAAPDNSAQKKQFLLQPAMPPGAPSNLMPGPALFFPMGQQQPAAANARPASSPSTTGAASGSASATASTSAPMNAVAPNSGPAMSFSYPNMGGNEAQFMAILGNGAYPFPIPAHVGAAPPYRGSHPPQAMSFYNGSFYSSQMLHHPSQLQQQQSQSMQIQQQIQQQSQQQSQPNASISTASSSSQKQLQNLQQQRPHGNSGNMNQGVQNFQANKGARASQPHHELGGEDSPSTADSRTRPNLSVYGQNFAMPPFHSANFALMTTPSSMGSNAAGVPNGNLGDKKQQQPQQTPAFPMSFATLNGATTPGLDISSIAHNHAMMQNLPEAARQNYQMMAAAAAAQVQVAQQKKNNHRGSEDGKTGAAAQSDPPNIDEERKALAARAAAAAATAGQSIAFSRDLSENSMPGNNVVDTSARSLNLIHGSSTRPTRSSAPNTMGNSNASSNSQQQQHNQQHQKQQQQQQQHQQQQQQQHQQQQQQHQQQQQQHQQQHQQQQQQQQMLFAKQQQYASPPAGSGRSKTPTTTNGNVYPDHLTSSSVMAAKFPNSLAGFPPLVQQTSGSPAQYSQWKNSVRPNTSQVSSQTIAGSNASNIKNLPQQQGRTQQNQTQISFGATASNPKASSASQGQQAQNNNQAPPSPMVVGSPSTPSVSVSKGAGGSPRTNAGASTGNKVGCQASTLSSQQGKNSQSPSLNSQKPSVVGSPHHIMSNTNSGNKPQMHQPQQQPQMSKQTIQQTQLFFNNYMQAAANTSAAMVGSGYYIQRHRPDNQQQQQQQQQHGSKSQGMGHTSSSSGMLSLCTPVSLANSSTSDPAKAVAAAAAAANHMKGNMPSQGMFHPSQFGAQSAGGGGGGAHQLMPAGFPYVHAVSTAVQVKPAEQKQPAGE